MSLDIISGYFLLNVYSYNHIEIMNCQNCNYLTSVVKLFYKIILTKNKEKNKKLCTNKYFGNVTGVEMILKEQI